ncbi:hypothetical protein [Legionella cherrii]|uniref:SidC homolog n=1 Tax=Legionella cherrii TaxID=28084 RepID=A0A0W0S942_9GAMM|nr:hypothetical protein [Legionella cherrii]KTC79429.1 hypothetical protein Lche_1449 [Legionella cherrii]VEB37241.1 SidC homolog [Legionella cherrii]
MAEYKIEKPELGTHFELSYAKVVKQIKENNTAFTGIPNKIKNQFLNFHHLLPNQQLELISNLSEIHDLPQEIIDLMNQFPYFETISHETLTRIGDFLKKKDPKTDKDISALIRTHKRAHALFQPNRLGDLLSLLLLNTATGQQDRAEKIVDMHPELQLQCGTLTDYSGRTFKNITAYEYAYWAKDTHMCRMLEKYMDAETRAAMLKRCEDIEVNGLTYIQHGVEIKGSKHFDFTPLKTALENYIKGYDVWLSTRNWDAMEVAWRKVGILQRDVPVHVANEYCRKDRAFDPLPTFKEKTLPRELSFYNYRTRKEDSWFPFVISDSANRVIDFVIRGAMQPVGGVVGWATASAIYDLAALVQLDKVRTGELTQLRANLRRVDLAPREVFPSSK